MKNIETILKEAGLEVTAEQLAAIDKEVKENYKTVTDYDKQKDKLTAAEDKVKTLTESLDKFKDVDAEKLNTEIADLKKQIAEIVGIPEYDAAAIRKQIQVIYVKDKDLLEFHFKDGRVETTHYVPPEKAFTPRSEVSREYMR